MTLTESDVTGPSGSATPFTNTLEALFAENVIVPRKKLAELAERAKAIEDENAELRTALAASREPVMCSVCLGKPLASGRECVCKGVGTEQAEMQGLRELCFEYERELAASRSEGEQDRDKIAALEHERAQFAMRVAIYGRFAHAVAASLDEDYPDESRRIVGLRVLRDEMVNELLSLTFPAVAQPETAE